MRRILLFVTWRVTLWGGAVGATLGACFGVGLLLSGTILTQSQSDWLYAVGGGLSYGLILGLLPGMVLGVVNGVALGGVLSIGVKRARGERGSVRRCTVMTMVFNAIIVVALLAHLFGPSLCATTVSVLASGALIILTAGGAAWVNARVARSCLRSLNHRVTTP